MLFDSGLAESIPRFFAPVLLAAIGSSLCERAGIFNIALEGMMLTGAFFAVVGCCFLGGWSGGLLLAILAGSMSGLIFWFFGIYRGGDDIIVSIGFNILAVGLTAFLLRSFFDVKGQFDDLRIVEVPKIDLGIIDHLPVLGGLLSGQSILVWFALSACIFTHVILKYHQRGLRVRGVGQNPSALRSVGVSPENVRLGVLLACGVLCALGGAQLSISNVTLFTEGMSAGRGWIALVIVMMCKARLLWILPTAIIFGFIDALGFRLQGLGMAQQFTEALPYVLAIFILILVFGRKTRP